MVTIAELVLGRPKENLTRVAGRMAFGLAGFITVSLLGNRILPHSVQETLKMSGLTPNGALFRVLARLYLMGGAGFLGGMMVGWWIDLVSPGWLRLWLFRSIRLFALALSAFLAIYCLYALYSGHLPLSICTIGLIVFLGLFGVIFVKF